MFSEHAAYFLPQILESSHLLQSRLKQPAAMRLYLINQKSKQHQIAEHTRKILVAVPKIVLKMISLVLKSVEPEFPTGRIEMTL